MGFWIGGVIAMVGIFLAGHWIGSLPKGPEEEYDYWKWTAGACPYWYRKLKRLYPHGTRVKLRELKDKGWSTKMCQAVWGWIAGQNPSLAWWTTDDGKIVGAGPLDELSNSDDSYSYEGRLDKYYITIDHDWNGERTWYQPSQ